MLSEDNCGDAEPDPRFGSPGVLFLGVSVVGDLGKRLSETNTSDA